MHYLGHPSLRLLCGYVREVRPDRGEGDAVEAEEGEAGLAELERGDRVMHDLPQ